jgi:hypothetical protein
MPKAKINPNQRPVEPPNQLAKIITNRPKNPSKNIVFKLLVVRRTKKPFLDQPVIPIYLYRITTVFATSHPQVDHMIDAFLICLDYDMSNP